MKETTWLICGLEIAMLEKNMRPASTALNALRRLLSARHHFESVVVPPSRPFSTLLSSPSICAYFRLLITCETDYETGSMDYKTVFIFSFARYLYSVTIGRGTWSSFRHARCPRLPFVHASEHATIFRRGHRIMRS